MVTGVVSTSCSCPHPSAGDRSASRLHESPPVERRQGGRGEGQVGVESLGRKKLREWEVGRGIWRHPTWAPRLQHLLLVSDPTSEPCFVIPFCLRSLTFPTDPSHTTPRPPLSGHQGHPREPAVWPTCDRANLEGGCRGQGGPRAVSWVNRWFFD